MVPWGLGKADYGDGGLSGCGGAVVRKIGAQRQHLSLNWVHRKTKKGVAGDHFTR